MQNEIEIGDIGPGTVGNCYIGAIANKAMYDKTMQKTLDNIRATQADGYNTKTAWVYEIRNGEFVLVASADTKEQAQAYMNAERVLVYAREKSAVKYIIGRTYNRYGIADYYMGKDEQDGQFTFSSKKAAFVFTNRNTAYGMTLRLKRLLPTIMGGNPATYQVVEITA